MHTRTWRNSKTDAQPSNKPYQKEIHIGERLDNNTCYKEQIHAQLDNTTCYGSRLMTD